MTALGYAPIPARFKYLDVFLAGRPRHQKMDPFWIRHPSMDVAKRAKIFAPFDALRGFSAAIIAKDALYEPKRDLSDEDTETLDRKLSALSELTRNGKAARENHVTVSVTYFVPCADRDNEAYRIRGRYETAAGICMNVDPVLRRLVLSDGRKISFEDIFRIEYEKGAPLRPEDRTEQQENH